MAKTKTAFTAKFSNGEVINIAASVKPYTNAYQVQFKDIDGEWQTVGGWSTSLELAERAAKGWVAKFNKTWCYKSRKFVPRPAETKVEIVAAIAQ